ncbi:BspA family leucine-rich repeat surface protein [Flavobacteriaceae bacterium]|nr:BspA family leucine-rich repeat surface protein [Flavobacteriaceae bacterium]
MKKLIYLFLALLIVACSSDDGNGGDEQSSCPIYLDSNGITIKACDDALVGDTGVIDGVTYTVVDETMLRDMAFGLPEDLTKVVTTFVTDMSLMFDNTLYDFNQNINSWDVSNVTTMAYMFSYMEYNQPIRDWDVSNVTDMRGMFEYNVTFNQPISSWDVSSVTDMSGMFASNFGDGFGEFNQDLSNWNVSSVNECSGFNYNTPQWTLPKPNLPSNCLE